MGTITGQQIIDRAWIKAHDTGAGGGVRWPSTEALLWVNDAQREIVNVLPKSNAKSATGSTTSGSRQTLTGLGVTDGLEVLDVVRKISGGPITLRSRAWFDDNRPGWHSEAGDPYHWTQDERDPKAFYIWKQNAGTSIEVVYAAAPTDLASLANAITLDDIYANAIQWFVLFSFYSKDSKYTASPQRAAMYYELFKSSLGVRERSIVTNDQSGQSKASGG